MPPSQIHLFSILICVPSKIAKENIHHIRDLMPFLQFPKKERYQNTPNLISGHLTTYSKDKKLHYKCRVIQSGTWDQGIGVIFFFPLPPHQKKRRRQFYFWCNFLSFHFDNNVCEFLWVAMIMLHWFNLVSWISHDSSKCKALKSFRASDQSEHLKKSLGTCQQLHYHIR